MPSLTFVFKALATSLSGHVEPRQGLALGWLGSVVAGLAMVFGTASQTQADPCFGIAGESHGSHKTTRPCEWKDHEPAEYWWEHYFHYSRTPADSSGQSPGCVYLTSTCGPSTAPVIAAETPTDTCFGIAEGSSGSYTTPYPCEWKDNKPAEYWWDHYFHSSETPADSSGQNPRCVYLTSTCGSSAATAIEAETPTTPSAFVLGANYPNPFNPATTIPLVLPADAEEVALTIYNVLGQPVRRVWAGSLAAGAHRLAWDGRDILGQPVAAGVYWYRLQVGDQTRTRKMVKIE